MFVHLIGLSNSLRIRSVEAHALETNIMLPQFWNLTVLDVSQINSFLLTASPCQEHQVLHNSSQNTLQTFLNAWGSAAMHFILKLANKYFDFHLTFRRAIFSYPSIFVAPHLVQRKISLNPCQTVRFCKSSCVIVLKKKNQNKVLETDRQTR